MSFIFCLFFLILRNFKRMLYIFLILLKSIINRKMNIIDKFLLNFFYAFKHPIQKKSSIYIYI